MKIQISDTIKNNTIFCFLSFFCAIFCAGILSKIENAFIAYPIAILVFASYITYLIFYIKKVKLIRFLLYPLSGILLLNMVSALLAPILVKNNAITSVLLSMIAICFWFMVLGGIGYGLFKDIPEIKNYKKKLVYKNTKIRNIIFFVVFAVLTCYFLYVVSPFAETHGFLSEAGEPDGQYIPMYCLMTMPVYFAYIVYLILEISQIRYIRFLAYPIIAFSLYFGFFFCLTFMGGAILWCIVFTIIPFLIIPLVCLIYGLTKDIPEIREYMSK